MSDIRTVTKYFLTFLADRHISPGLTRTLCCKVIHPISISVHVCQTCERKATGVAGRCVRFTLKDSPGAKGKKDRVFSALPHFPARRALRWTALSGKLTFKWRPTSASVSSSCGALDRITSMLRATRNRHNDTRYAWRMQGASVKVFFFFFRVPGFILHNPLYCDKLDNSDIFWSPNSDVY